MSGEVNRHLVLGDVAWQFPTARRPELPTVLIPLSAGAGHAAVELIRFDDASAPGPWHIVGSDGSITELHGPTSGPVWLGTVMAPPVRAALLTAMSGQVTESQLDSLAPLAVTRAHSHSEAATAEVLACARLRAGGALFTRVSRPECDGSVAALVDAVVSALADHQPHVLTETEGCTVFAPDVEVETKLSLTGRLSPWALATRLSQLVGSKALGGFIPDLGNEMQRWQTYQRSWEVLSPSEEAGYLAVITYGSGNHFLKRKRFQQDGLKREETFKFGLDVPEEGVDQYVRNLYPGLEVRALPSHRRSKFDVNVESVRTGHFYGIEIDEVVLEDSAACMSQVEIEYHRSRIHDGLEPSSIEPELERLTSLVRQVVTDLGERPESTFYSKLSFLRDVVDRGGSPHDLKVSEAAG